MSTTKRNLLKNLWTINPFQRPKASLFSPSCHIVQYQINYLRVAWLSQMFFGLTLSKPLCTKNYFCFEEISSMEYLQFLSNFKKHCGSCHHNAESNSDFDSIEHNELMGTRRVTFISSNTYDSRWKLYIFGPKKVHGAEPQKKCLLFEGSSRKIIFCWVVSELPHHQ